MQKKKFISIGSSFLVLLLTLIACLIIPNFTSIKSVSAYTGEGPDANGLYYTLVDGTHYQVSDCNQSDLTVEIPSIYNGLPVTEIRQSSFEDCSQIISVIIPNSITGIGAYAFENCSGLTSINIPNSVNYISTRIFENCDNLISVTLSNNLTRIEDFTFFGCDNLTSITIPSSVTSIEFDAFTECSKLVQITNLSNFSLSANYCSQNLGTEIRKSTSASFSNTLSDFDSNGVQTFTIGSDVYLISVDKSKTNLDLSSYTFNKIYEYGFYQCNKISSIVLPNIITSIESYAFQNCTGLNSIDIPNSVTTIENYAFHNCSNLTSITIPSSVNSIGEYAFQNCTGLNTINLPNSINSVGRNAFQNCSNLTSIIIPNSITSTGYETFSGCSSLTSVVIQHGVINIGSFSFKNCSNLTSIIIPGSITNIYDSAFYGCSNLTIIIMKSTTPPNLSNTNAISTATIAIYVPSANLNAYKAATNWKSFSTKIFAMNSFTVTFKNHDGAILDTQTVEHGSSAIAPANPTRTGYTFTGWDKVLTNITENTTITATYNVVNYDISYTLDGGSVSGNSATYNIESSDITLINPTKTGYTFKGWTGTDLAEATMTVVIPAESTGARTYTATWEINTFTVTFKDYDGTTLKTETVNYGASAIEPTEPTRTGYTFNGWDKALTNITENTTITAQYTINSYTVTFKDYDGTTLKTETVNYDSSATAPADPTRTATAQYTYTFTGWNPADFSNITADLTVTAQYSSTTNSYTVTFKNWDGTTLDTQTVEYGSAATAPANPTKDPDAQYTYTFTNWDYSFNNITSDLTVTAQYTNGVNTFTVTFKDYDGTTLKIQTVEYGSSATAPAATRTGYTFTGWDKGLTNITENTTITAQYTINSYTVTFKDHDGSTLKTETVNYGSGATAPADPSRTGYTFTGWDVAYSNITANLTVTAQYTINTYIVTFIVDGVQYGSTQNVDYGNLVSEPANPVKDGFDFDCWCTDEALTQNYSFETPISASDLTLYAKFTGIVGFKMDEESETETLALTVGKEYQDLETLKEEKSNVKTGYTLTGWEYKNLETNETGSINQTTNFDFLYQGKGMIFAKFEANTYTVNFRVNPGDENAELDSQEITYDSIIEFLPNPTRNGYTFGGWYIGDTKIESGMTFKIAEDVTLTAMWIENPINLTWMYVAAGTILTVLVISIMIVLSKKNKMKKFQFKK